MMALLPLLQVADVLQVNGVRRGCGVSAVYTLCRCSSCRLRSLQGSSLHHVHCWLILFQTDLDLMAASCCIASSEVAPQCKADFVILTRVACHRMDAADMTTSFWDNYVVQNLNVPRSEGGSNQVVGSAS
jgi:hypothetical protein